ncbi:YlzJ-like family protein [Sporolituus thermophilus]|uniref:YlzJ-like protein n=1 Tax=Sporolituus thermophilus DSM 23256 TaxID=1123285 RepID=A0A1G7NR38_9FIRM|nr:YlzJ-like family protein [Sporolituus thermophilus]SDF76421.1 YlzJ-like protein [Sporolituus thermophilus DSM 23256]
MILWTVMPLEIVLEGLDAQPNYEEIDYNGLTVVVERLSPVQCRVIRIISTDPQDYLRSDLQPGTVLTYQPVVKAV